MATAAEGTGRTVEVEGYRGAFTDLGDGRTVAFEEFTGDGDPAPLFRGLPDDRCPCVHEGYVLAGRMVFRYADREEVVEAGQAYRAEPGHLPLPAPGTRTVEFTATADLARTMDVVGANLAAMAGSR